MRLSRVNKSRLPLKPAWLDGEVVALTDDGAVSFQLLQNAVRRGGTARKLKCRRRQEFVRGGYSERAGAREKFGAPFTASSSKKSAPEESSSITCEMAGWRRRSLHTPRARPPERTGGDADPLG